MIHINSRKYIKYTENFDIIHYTNYAIPFKKNKKSKYVVTIHDLASFSCKSSLPLLYRIYNRFVTKISILNADAVFVVSNSIKSEILTRWPQYKNKLYVTYPGFYSEFKQPKNIIERNNIFKNKKLLNLEKKNYFLFVGTLETRKNLGILIKSYILLREEHSNLNVKLVLVGREGYGFKYYSNLILNSKYKDDIILAGYTEDEDIIKLYENTSAFIFPSHYEGFGSPQLEAIHFNIPLLVSDIPTNREISSDYGIFFDKDNVIDLKNKLYNIIYCNENDKILFDISIKSNRILKEFNWKKLIEEKYIIYYRSIL